jgi:hypothetical protein
MTADSIENSPIHVTSLTRAMRRRAAGFYYKPSGHIGLVEDWIEGRDDGADVDEDVRDLAKLLEDVWSDGLHATVRDR